MTQEIFAVVTKDSASGNVDFTVSGFSAGACIAYVTNATADDTKTQTILYCKGFSDFTRHRCVIGMRQHQVDAKHRDMADKFIRHRNTSGTVVLEGDVTAITDGVRINFTTHASAYRVTVVMLSNADGQQYYCNHWTTVTDVVDTEETVTAPGFQVDILFGAWNGRPITLPQGTSAVWARGEAIAVRSGSTWDQFCKTTVASSASGNADNETIISDTKFVRHLELTGSVTRELELTGTDANGFKITPRTNIFGARELIYLACTKGTKAVQLKSIDTPVSDSIDWVVSDFSFQPQGIIYSGGRLTSFDSINNAGNAWSVWESVFDGTTARVASSINCEDGASPVPVTSSSAHSGTYTKFILAHTVAGGVVDLDVGAPVFGPNGFTVDATDIGTVVSPARKAYMLAIGPTMSFTTVQGTVTFTGNNQMIAIGLGFTTNNEALSFTGNTATIDIAGVDRFAKVSSTGSDTGNHWFDNLASAQASPYLTIAEANTDAIDGHSGDQFLFLERGETFTENVVWSKGGSSPTARVIIDADGTGADPIVDGTTGVAWIQQKSYSLMRNVELQTTAGVASRYGWSNTSGGAGHTLDAVTINAAAGIRVQGLQQGGIDVNNCTIHTTDNDAVQQQASSGTGTPGGLRFDNTTFTVDEDAVNADGIQIIMPTVNSTDLTVTDCTFNINVDKATSSEVKECINYLGGADFTVSGCTFRSQVADNDNFHSLGISVKYADNVSITTSTFTNLQRGIRFEANTGSSPGVSGTVLVEGITIHGQDGANANGYELGVQEGAGASHPSTATWEWRNITLATNDGGVQVDLQASPTFSVRMRNINAYRVGTGASGTRYLLEIDADGAGVIDAATDNNNYYTTDSSSNYITYDGTDHSNATLATALAAYIADIDADHAGAESNSIADDPEFISLGTEDLRPSSDSDLYLGGVAIATTVYQTGNEIGSNPTIGGLPALLDIAHANEAVSFTGNAANIGISIDITQANELVSFTGNQTTIQADVDTNFNTTNAPIAFEGNQAVIDLQGNIFINQVNEEVTFTGNQATIDTGIGIAVNPDEIQFTGNPVQIQTDTDTNFTTNNELVSFPGNNQGIVLDAGNIEFTTINSTVNFFRRRHRIQAGAKRGGQSHRRRIQREAQIRADDDVVVMLLEQMRGR